MKRFALIGLLASSALFGLAQAQNYIPQNNPIPVPVIQALNQNDTIQVVPHGVPGVQNFYATPGQISGVTSYVYTVPVTGFSLTFANGQDTFILAPAGTLATGGFTFAPNPSDGQRDCVVSNQIVTAATFTANSGQTVFGAPSALAAGVSACFVYVAPVAIWFRS